MTVMYLHDHGPKISLQAKKLFFKDNSKKVVLGAYLVDKLLRKVILNIYSLGSHTQPPQAQNGCDMVEMPCLLIDLKSTSDPAYNTAQFKF